MDLCEAFELVVAPVGPDNPRNSEAAIFPLRGSTLLLGWTDFYAGGGADHAPARLVGKLSEDGGRSWGAPYTLVENDGGCNVMEVNFLRLKNDDIALCHCQKNTESTDCRIIMRVSKDEGKTFVDPRQLSPDGKYTGLTNGRSIRLSKGRILLEAWEGGDSYCCISDDEGQAWHDSQRIQPTDGGCWEPACVELKDGRVMMLMRTRLGGQYKSISEDGGESWSDPTPTDLVAPAAPASARRLPGSDAILILYNDRQGVAYSPDRRTPFHHRTPLAAAVSDDGGRSWQRRGLVEADGHKSYCYASIAFHGADTLLTYYVGVAGGPNLLDLKLCIVPTDAWVT